MDRIFKNTLYICGYKDITEKLVSDIDIIVSILEFKPSFNFEVKEHVWYYAEDEDDFDISIYFSNFYDFIMKNISKKILVHCYCGVSRSVTLIASFILKFHINSKKERVFRKFYTIDKILANIHKKRNIISPNDGFLNLLEKYQGNLIKKRYL